MVTLEKRQVRAVGNRNQGGLASRKLENAPKPNEDLQGDVLNKIMGRLEKLEQGNFTYEKRNDRPQSQGTYFIFKSREYSIKDCPMYKRCQEQMSNLNAGSAGMQGKVILSTH